MSSGLHHSSGGTLRSGYTTGSCAAAAAAAAVSYLCSQNPLSLVSIDLPAGGVASLPVAECHGSRSEAQAVVVKDAGDDPDVTHGASIVARASWQEPGSPAVVISAGEGVGIVTRPGLPVRVGEPAINPVPRKMIMHEVQKMLSLHHCQKPVRVEISVPGGEEIARKTLNSRLGIVGGISILGTRGIVVPFSNSAYKVSLVRQIRMVAMSGGRQIVLSTGGRSEKFARNLYPDLDEAAFIEAGEFIGYALRQCRRYGIVKVTLSGMMGKLSKVAEGVMMVHSARSSVNFDFLSSLARKYGANENLCHQILSANTAAQVAELVLENGLNRFFAGLAGLCSLNCHKISGVESETLLFTLEGQLLARAPGPQN